MSRDLKPRLQTKKPKSGSRGSTLVGIFVGLILGAWWRRGLRCISRHRPLPEAQAG
jgi:hypothetical protein